MAFDRSSIRDEYVRLSNGTSVAVSKLSDDTLRKYAINHPNILNNGWIVSNGKIVRGATPTTTPVRPPASTAPQPTSPVSPVTPAPTQDDQSVAQQVQAQYTLAQQYNDLAPIMDKMGLTFIDPSRGDDGLFASDNIRLSDYKSKLDDLQHAGYSYVSRLDPEKKLTGLDRYQFNNKAIEEEASRAMNSVNSRMARSGIAGSGQVSIAKNSIAQKASDDSYNNLRSYGTYDDAKSFVDSYGGDLDSIKSQTAQGTLDSSNRNAVTAYSAASIGARNRFYSDPSNNGLYQKYVGSVM